MKVSRLLVVLIALMLLYASLPGRTTQAASLVEVTNFGANPTNLRMFEYVPNNVAARPAILVAVHFCTGSGPALFSGTEFASLADRFGFIVVYPSTTRNGNCFDVSTAGALTHNGNSDPVGIVSMVQNTIQRHNGDSSRVYVTGVSSGAMMTNVLLGDYPDVFKAGAAFMGVPFACFATSAGDPTNPANQAGWNNTCANGQSIMTPQQWGNLARGAFPGFSGPRPRMQLWHGTADTTLQFPNFGEEIKQWTNVFGISQTPSTTDTPQSGWTHTTYKDSSGTVVVEGYAISGVGHSLPQSGMAAIAIHFFGLDGAPQPTPTRTNTPTGPSPTQTRTPTTGPSPTPTRTPTPGQVGTCQVTYTITNQWNNGFQTSVDIKNTGSAAINGWTVRWAFPNGQTLIQLWNATSTQTGANVSATNLSWNATIAPNATVNVGFTANWSGANNKPTSFTLNNAACTVTP